MDTKIDTQREREIDVRELEGVVSVGRDVSERSVGTMMLLHCHGTHGRTAQALHNHCTRIAQSQHKHGHCLAATLWHGFA